jgi:hypothetical protein
MQLTLLDFSKTLEIHWNLHNSLLFSKYFINNNKTKYYELLFENLNKYRFLNNLKINNIFILDENNLGILEDIEDILSIKNYRNYKITLLKSNS